MRSLAPPSRSSSSGGRIRRALEDVDAHTVGGAAAGLRRGPRRPLRGFDAGRRLDLSRTYKASRPHPSPLLFSGNNVLDWLRRAGLVVIGQRKYRGPSEAAARCLDAVVVQ